MPIRFQCPKCGGAYEAPADYDGRYVACHYCNDAFVINRPDSLPRSMRAPIPLANRMAMRAVPCTIGVLMLVVCTLTFRWWYFADDRGLVFPLVGVLWLAVVMPFGLIIAHGMFRRPLEPPFSLNRFAIIVFGLLGAVVTFLALGLVVPVFLIRMAHIEEGRGVLKEFFCIWFCEGLVCLWLAHWGEKLKKRVISAKTLTDEVVAVLSFLAKSAFLLGTPFASTHFTVSGLFQFHCILGSCVLLWWSFTHPPEGKALQNVGALLFAVPCVFLFSLFVITIASHVLFGTEPPGGRHTWALAFLFTDESMLALLMASTIVGCCVNKGQKPEAE